MSQSPEDVHGGDLLSLVRGFVPKLRDYACLGMDVEEFAIRTHEWHLVVPVEVDPDDPPRGVELYRKPEDRWDQNDVAEQNPEVAEHLELTLHRFVAALRLGGPLEPPAMWSVCQGERQGPNRVGSVVPVMPNSGVFVLPRNTSPAAR